MGIYESVHDKIIQNYNFFLVIDSKPQRKKNHAQKCDPCEHLRSCKKELEIEGAMARKQHGVLFSVFTEGACKQNIGSIV